MVKSEYPEEEILMSEKTSEDEYMQGDWPQNPHSVSTTSQHEGPSPTRSNSDGANDTSSDGAHNNDLKGHIVNGVPADDRRMRRQIANCNERRRMQSINAGFQSLRSLLPRKDGEKMSKAAILQQTAEYIHSLLDEKERLLQENNSAAAKKRKVDYEEHMDVEASESKPVAVQPPPPPQPQPLPSFEVMDYLRSIEELKTALAKEQRLRLLLENELFEVRAKSINDAAASLGVLRAHSSLFQTTLSNPLEPTPTESTAFSLPSRTQSGLAPPPTLTHDSSLLAAAAAQNLYSNVVLNGAPPQPSMSNLVSPTLPPTHQHSTSFNFASTTSSALAGLPQPVPQRFPLTSNDTNSVLRLATANLEIPSAQSVFSPTDSNGGSVLQRPSPPTSTSTTLAQRNLQAILEAIRHIEGGVATRTAANASPACSSADLMVR